MLFCTTLAEFKAPTSKGREGGSGGSPLLFSADLRP